MSNVIQLFKPEPSKEEGLISIAKVITDLAETHGVDIYDPNFPIRCNTIVTLTQLMINDSKKV